MQSETERNSGTPPLIFDRFAAFYDGDYRHYDDDLDAISQLAEEEDGSILELGCGTGRVLVPLAGLGHAVTGVDISPSLLDVTRAKLRTTHYAPRATLLESDLRTFDLPAKNYALAICTSNTLMHFTSPEEQLAVLQNAHRHLRPGGLLFIDLFNPDVTRLNEISGMMELADQWTDEERGTHMIKWCVRTVDWAEQLQETLFIYEEQFADGRNQRISCPFPLRFLWRNEGQLMLEKAGFTVEEIWGDFDGSEYYSGSDHLIFLARK